jgi:hydroxymethylcytosylglucuronate/cytosylglucuronate synthase
VDSIPYLWTPEDKLALTVAVYCAQRGWELSDLARAALSQVPQVTWIDAVLPVQRDRASARGRTAVLNFGGLHSPTNVDRNPQYLSLVAPPAIRALTDAGYDHIEVCGNLTAADLGGAPVGAADVRVGPRSHEEFMGVLSAAALLLTSPGLTTLLEASALGTPMVCLPPQNLSQVFHGERFAWAFGGECQVTWPEAVLDLVRLLEVRASGEDAGLRFIDSSLAAQDPAALYLPLYDAISGGIRATAGKDRDWGILLKQSGRSGADQVASLVFQMIASGGNPSANKIR